MGRSKLIFFTRKTCCTCKAMYPTWNKAAEELSGYDYELVDCDEDFDTAKAFGVSTLPTFVRVDSSGHFVSSRSGFIPEKAFMEWLA